MSGPAGESEVSSDLRNTAEMQARVGRVEGTPEVTPAEVAQLVAWLRWASREVRGGMDPYVRVRGAAQSDAYGRTADELERIGGKGSAALLALAASLRARSVSQEVPADVRFPTLWRADRPVPELDPERVRREQRLGFGLGLARAAAHIHVAAGGRV